MLYSLFQHSPCPPQRLTCGCSLTLSLRQIRQSFLAAVRSRWQFSLRTILAAMTGFPLFLDDR